MSATPTQRIVPGAPPPISTSKSSHKKKKKVTAVTTAAVGDTSAAPSPLVATQNLEVVTNGVSNQGTPPAPSTPAIDSQPLQKLFPVAELINKRLKTNQKKVRRFKEYSNSEAELNSDQINSVASLPGLEAVVKELEEVRKAVEVHESELSKEESIKRAAADEAQKAAAAEAVAEAKVASEATAGLLLTFLRLPTLISHSHPLIVSAGVTDAESLAIESAVETLRGEESQSKSDTLSGFFSGEGELQGISYSRFIEIAQAVRRPQQHTPEEDVAESAIHEPASDATGHGHAGGLSFIHESELDNGIDTPVVDDVPPVDEAAQCEVEPVPEQKPVEVTELTQPSGPIDWSAEDEHDLPPISGLQESFGEAQPTTPAVDDQAPTEEDGFTTRHTGRGRGPRGERRGGRGGYRGEGGGRGYNRGDRGGRGSYRGRGDGEFRGRGDGYRGRGDGEWRGRGEGFRGRGDGHEGYRGRGNGHEGYRGREDGQDGYRGRGRGRGEGRGGPPPQPQQE